MSSYPQDSDITLAALDQKKLGELTKGEMHLVINNLKPKAQLHTGIRFLNILLERRGVKAVIECVEKIHRVLDNEGKLLDYDLEGYEDIFRSAHLNVMTRRNFLHTLGWGIPGAITTVGGIAKILDQTVTSVSDNHPSTQTSARNEETNPFRKTHEWIDHNLAGAEYTIIGLALMNECVEKWKEIKLEQVANAIAEVAEKYPSSQSSGRA
jgi:hypothetical protein